MDDITVGEINSEDERGRAIEEQRGAHYLVGGFYLNEDKTKVTWQSPNPELLDTETFSACLAQLMMHFMKDNPKVGQMEIMRSVQTAMFTLYNESQE